MCRCSCRRCDCLAGFVATVDAFDARAIVHVAADSPFIDPVLVDRLVSTADAHPDCDYISYCFADGRPAILAQWGVVAEWCSAASLRPLIARPSGRPTATRPPDICEPSPTSSRRG